MTVHGQLDEQQLAALERVFAGTEPWTFELYPPLCGLGSALSRLSLPDMPASLSFGDVLQAFEELRASQLAPWPTHAAVAESTASELGYVSTSASISRVRDANAASWREHALHNKELLLRGAAQASGRRALVIGAGKLYDIPLRKLAERFEQLLLVDIDAAAMAESVRQVDLEPKLQARLSLVQADVTGINDVFLQKAQAALALADEPDVYAALLRLLQDYYLAEPPQLLPDQAATDALCFACSSMVLSQLATPLTHYLQTRFATRFPTSQRTQAPEFQIALAQFTHRVQQAHVRSLLAVAPTIALTSDLTEQYTALDPRGNLMEAVSRMPLIGGPSLEALIPRLQARSLLTASWQWRHVVPTKNKPQGRTVQVAGVVAQRI